MLLNRFLDRTEFTSYEDFKENYKVNIPENFNFGYDVVDAWAEFDENKRALVWCNDNNEERIFTFSDLKRLSNQTANWFKSLGITKGDKVILFLRRRYEYWICAVALHKMGAILIPASLQLTAKDIKYRSKAAGIKAIISYNDSYILEQIEAALPECDTITTKIIVAGKREGWFNFDEGIEQQSQVFDRPTGELKTYNNEIFLTYFTSGTTGMPKMVAHNHTHPLGHIVTAKYWQRVIEDKLH